ncbi:dTDP-4-dehydrorhamnose reductase [Maribacter sp. 2210JD10-5]|uniref:dTDP-4-dehydrorhamnose reductase n=1 Tax=Maribacter sp. 2210JD10-5 TaxID=3386272 RepID=UPI0039BD869B
MKKVLVTGANGQLGQCIQKIAEEYDSVDFVFKDSKELNIINADKVDSIFKDINFDFCINCAAYTNVEQAEKTPEIAFKVNAEGVRNLALACKDYNVVLIHISTDYVFDGEKEGPYTVEDIPNPINEYGKSKLRGEKYIQEILGNYLIIRTSWLYSELERNFYSTILKKAKAGEELRITDDQTGCPTNALHLARFIIEQLSIARPNSGILHFTDGKAMTWYGFAKLILEENNLACKVQLVKDDNYRTFANRPRNSVLYTL